MTNTNNKHIVNLKVNTKNFILTKCYNCVKENLQESKIQTDGTFSSSFNIMFKQNL